ncbi:unnamed protein product [Blepharisma stoltei]|uniref:Uncharacterized protein n=1 Tax=Blepharisma stoltei TaxID=1481888 RepID=A0AAU9J3A8_9CILI|nr:unnamed protein product [Blepharisma stoltei]
MASGRKHVLKVLIIGDSAVGKTSLLNQYVNQRFNQRYQATIGADFLTKDIEIDGRTVTLQIWDTAGQERFQSLGTAFYRGTDCCVIVYDITSSKSFDTIQQWKEGFLNQSGVKDPENFPFVVLGNKVDKENERAVPNAKAAQWCRDNGNIPFYETSAKDAINVKEAFTSITRKAMLQVKNDTIEYKPPIELSKVRPKQAQSTCC